MNSDSVMINVENDTGGGGPVINNYFEMTKNEITVAVGITVISVSNLER